MITCVDFLFKGYEAKIEKNYITKSIILYIILYYKEHRDVL
jgi:hypothetical protein